MRKHREGEGALTAEETGMGLMTRLAERSFLQSPDGRALLYLSPSRRPYLVEDEAVRGRIVRKLGRFYMFMFAAIIVTLEIVMNMAPDAIFEPLPLLGLLGGFVALAILLPRLLLQGEVRDLPRWDGAITREAAFAQRMAGLSTGRLVFGLLGSAMFVAIGCWMIVQGAGPVLPAITIGFFGFCFVAWGRALAARLRSRV